MCALQNIDELFITLDVVLGNEQPDGTGGG
jgi:hypothetical protein